VRESLSSLSRPLPPTLGHNPTCEDRSCRYGISAQSRRTCLCLITLPCLPRFQTARITFFNSSRTVPFIRVAPSPRPLVSPIEIILLDLDFSQPADRFSQPLPCRSISSCTRNPDFRVCSVEVCNVAPCPPISIPFDPVFPSLLLRPSQLIPFFFFSLLDDERLLPYGLTPLFFLCPSFCDLTRPIDLCPGYPSGRVFSLPYRRRSLVFFSSSTVCVHRSRQAL